MFNICSTAHSYRPPGPKSPLSKCGGRPYGSFGPGGPRLSFGGILLLPGGGKNAGLTWGAGGGPPGGGPGMCGGGAKAMGGPMGPGGRNGKGPGGGGPC